MSDTPKHEKRTHFRGKARPGRRVALSYSRAGNDSDRADSNSEAITRNIGVGGAFVLTDSPFPVGTILDIDLDVPTCDEPIRVEAEVRWIVDAAEDPDGAGMGVKFRDVGVEALLQLSEYFASLTGAD